MCQAHLPTPGEGRGRGPAEGRGEGRGSQQPEKTCLFSGGQSPVCTSSLPRALPAAARLGPILPTRGSPHTTPARPSACHTSRAPVPGRVVESPSLRSGPTTGRQQGAPSLSSWTQTRASVSLPIIYTRSIPLRIPIRKAVPSVSAFHRE